MTALTVTQFVNLINEAWETIGDITVEGEVIEFKIIQNKWVVFDLKDKESVVKCFMTIWKYKTQVEDGMLVRVTGQPKLRNKGFFSFVLESVQPAGEGALRRAFELMKQKLLQEGLFAPERKRALPRFPQHIAFITSRDAAAYGDFLKVLKGRQGGLTISFLHTAVQGEDAVSQIIDALEQANTQLLGVDAIVMVRGGGSMEDLQAFNDERVVRAVAASRIPTVVGVGHERDVSLAELAADVRASTPSNAAELLVRTRAEIIGNIESHARRLQHITHDQLGWRQRLVTQQTSHLRTSISRSKQKIQNNIMLLFGFQRLLMQQIGKRGARVRAGRIALHHQMERALQSGRQRAAQATRLLQSLAPERVLARGYSITRLPDGRILKEGAQAAPGAILTTQLSKGSVTSTVTGKRPQLELGI